MLCTHRDTSLFVHGGAGVGQSSAPPCPGRTVLACLSGRVGDLCVIVGDPVAVSARFPREGPRAVLWHH